MTEQNSNNTSWIMDTNAAVLSGLFVGARIAAGGSIAVEALGIGNSVAMALFTGIATGGTATSFGGAALGAIISEGGLVLLG
jgi:hypothetical protein